MRIAALWFPDWPFHAVPGRTPQAIIKGHVLWACDAVARSAGLNRGMPLTQARALCPQLNVVSYEPDRYYRAFEPIIAGLDHVTASVEVLRPGLALINVEGVAHYYGGEDYAAELLIDAASYCGVDVFLGIADEVTTAVLAARAGLVVPPGLSREFLSGVLLDAVVAEPALEVDTEIVSICKRMGLTTLGDVAHLPQRSVVTRFGKAGQRLHDIALGRTRGSVIPLQKQADYSVTYVPEEPVKRVDTAAFLARELAVELHHKLRNAGVICRRLKIVAVSSPQVRESEGESASAVGGSEKLERVWHLREGIDEKAIAARVRWQLDGWINSGAAGEVTELSLIPEEICVPSMEDELWSPTGTSHKAERAAIRVQSMLGIDQVVQPVMVGGRGVAERITFVPYGEKREDDGTVWVGQIPAPLPSRLAQPNIQKSQSSPAKQEFTEHSSREASSDAQVTVMGSEEQPVIVTAEALLSRPPMQMHWKGESYLITGWSGPWPVSTHKEHCARMEIVGTDSEGKPQAWLIRWSNGSWRVEASYG